MEKFPILYVDDEEHNLISFVATFRKEYKIHTAINGNEAIEIMRHNDIKLVITDHRSVRRGVASWHRSNCLPTRRNRA